jgi:hypothetical protein
MISKGSLVTFDMYALFFEDVTPIYVVISAPYEWNSYGDILQVVDIFDKTGSRAANIEHLKLIACP